MSARIAVVGGCNVDITATSYSPLVFGDSNPGRMEISLGGVGRNIAENLARLGFDTRLLSAVGNDQYYALLQSNASTAGFDISDCLLLDDVHTSCYLCVNQPDGDIAVAVAAMDICERITPAFLAGKLDMLNACDYVAMDANLPEEALCYLTQHCTAKLCADTVSEKKAVKLKSVLPALWLLKANRAEAQAITGLTLDDDHSFERAAAYLHQLGVKNVAITASEKRAFFSNGSESRMLPPMHAQTVNSTGCGDAFFAGALAALAAGRSARDTLAHGLAMASICAASDCAVSPAASMDEIRRTIEKYTGGEAK